MIIPFLRPQCTSIFDWRKWRKTWHDICRSDEVTTLNDTPSDTTQRSVSEQTIMHPCKYTFIIQLPIKNPKKEWNTGIPLCFTTLLIMCYTGKKIKIIIIIARLYSGISYFGSSARFASTQAYLRIHCYAPTRFIGFILCCEEQI